MKSAEKRLTPANIGVMAVCAGITALVALLAMPAVELIQAQVNPAPRMSGESPVRSESVMQFYANVAAGALNFLTGVRGPVPMATQESGNPNPPQIVLPKDYNQWQSHVADVLAPHDAPPDKQQMLGKTYVNELGNAVGQDNLQNLVKTFLSDPNYPYYAYALFLGFAMLLSAIAINAIGRVESEEVTVIPVKK